MQLPHSQPSDFASIPDELKNRNQWVCWQYEHRPGRPKQSQCKRPITARTGLAANVNASPTWSSFEAALAKFLEPRSRLAGIGFVFTDKDPYVGIDLDHCREPRTGALEAWATSILNELGTYSEVSPSETGVKCIAKTDGIFASRRCSKPSIEIYPSRRFFALTGQMLEGPSEIRDRTSTLHSLYGRLFSETLPTPELTWEFKQGVENAGDEVVLKRAREAGNASKFRSLWNGDLSRHGNNASEADLALCRILAFWCGDNPIQIDRLFRRSKLYRTKWDTVHYSNEQTYGQRTTLRAIADQNGVFYAWKN